MYYKVEFPKRKFDKRRDASTIKTKEFSLPLVNAKHGSNGIMYYGRPEIFDSEEMTIDIVQNGAIATGDVYPQPQKTGVLWDAYLIKARHHADTKRTLCYIATAIYKAIKPKYSYDDKAYWESVSKDEIILPVDKTGKIDFDFMEKSIRALEQARIRALEAYLRAAGFSDTRLTSVESVAIANFSKRRMLPFKIGALFSAQVGDVDLQQRDINGRGTYFVNSGVQNCGIKGRTDRPARMFAANTITIDFLGHAYFRPFVYKLATHNHVFSLSSDLIKSEAVGIFFVSAMRFLSKVFSFNNMGTWPQIREQEILLPVTSKNKIDFAFIESFIKGQMKMAIGRVMEWKDQEIAVTKKVAEVSDRKAIFHYDVPEEDESPRLAADENDE